MKNEKSNNFVVSCDIGSTHITMLGAHVTDGINVLGAVRVPNQSVKAGQILSLEQLIESLHEASDELEHQTGLSINTVRVTLPASEITSSLFKEEIVLRENEAQEADIHKIISNVRAHKPPSNQEWLHVLSNAYELDGKKNIRDPRGLFGSKLSLLVHGIAAPVSEVKTLARALARTGLKAESFSFQGKIGRAHV